MKPKLIEDLRRARIENDVREAYSSELKRRKIKKEPTKYLVDAIYTLESKGERRQIIAEFKDDWKFTDSPTDRGKVIAQCLRYIKEFEIQGELLPGAVMVADINECFVLSTSILKPYLYRQDLDWSICASDFGNKHPLLVVELQRLDVGVMDINDGFDPQQLTDLLYAAAFDVNTHIKLTCDNIANVHRQFVDKVLNDTKLTEHDIPNLLLQIILQPEEHQLLANGKLKTKSFGEIKVRGKAYNSFFTMFEGQNYTLEEQSRLLECSDKLIKEQPRRNNGDFYTPKNIAELANTYMETVYGKDYRERYTIWDCAAGKGNLTVDRQYSDLWLTTLHQSDVDSMIAGGVNPEANIRQFDFLNDDISKIPELEALIASGKPLMFVVNPPYGRPGAGGDLMTSVVDAGVAKNNTCEAMKVEGVYKASAQLYAQFLWRMTKFAEINKNVSVNVFSVNKLYNGESLKSIRELMNNKFEFQTGFKFSAAMFESASDAWACAFGIWKVKKG